MLTFPTPKLVPQLPPKMSFAHCGAPIWGRVDRPAGIIEFIEYYRLMGVSKFFWYDMDASNRTRDVLRYYASKGVVHLTKWILPWTQSEGKVIHYFGQLAALYDCAMKTSASHDHTVVCKSKVCQLHQKLWLSRGFFRL
jgi:Glycosyltransferase family 92